ncbi:uncharacterized protein LOC108702312 [Xenopus laevis]|uniref:Uncharacterized protein LOC108702312 n=1 Tax=Xenopus laevis TaxID=8355 RepID=A0A8J0TYD1_XENLA|nr:uncharacterized protein LOC108702312 [Xenopus laevis]
MARCWPGTILFSSKAPRKLVFLFTLSLSVTYLFYSLLNCYSSLQFPLQDASDFLQPEAAISPTGTIRSASLKPDTISRSVPSQPAPRSSQPSPGRTAQGKSASRNRSSGSRSSSRRAPQINTSRTNNSTKQLSPEQPGRIGVSSTKERQRSLLESNLEISTAGATSSQSINVKSPHVPPATPTDNPSASSLQSHPGFHSANSNWDPLSGFPSNLSAGDSDADIPVTVKVVAEERSVQSGAGNRLRSSVEKSSTSDRIPVNSEKSSTLDSDPIHAARIEISTVDSDPIHSAGEKVSRADGAAEKRATFIFLAQTTSTSESVTDQLEISGIPSHPPAQDLETLKAGSHLRSSISGQKSSILDGDLIPKKPTKVNISGKGPLYPIGTETSSEGNHTIPTPQTSGTWDRITNSSRRTSYDFTVQSRAFPAGSFDTKLLNSVSSTSSVLLSPSAVRNTSGYNPFPRESGKPESAPLPITETIYDKASHYKQKDSTETWETASSSAETLISPDLEGDEAYKSMRSLSYWDRTPLAATEMIPESHTGALEKDTQESSTAEEELNRRFPVNCTPEYGEKKLPQAIIIGVKKGGTRALLEALRAHPDVRAVGVEPHFFDRNYEKGLEWYRDLMPRTIDGQITMEKTPSYFVTNEAPQRIHSMAKDTKLIVVVRNPVTRAISDYTQTLSKKPEIPTFEVLAFKNRTLGLIDASWSALRIGIYALHLESWMQYFPLSQILFVSGERLISNPAEELAKVQDFLGLRRIITEKYFYFNKTKGFPCLKKPEDTGAPRCLGKSKGRTHPKIDPDVIQRLRKFYKPFNSMFYQMTGEDFQWEKDELESWTSG